MKAPGRLLTRLLLAAVALGLGAPLEAAADAPRVWVATPELVPFELALDEVELHWTGAEAEAHALSTAGIPEARLVAQRHGRARLALAGVTTASELARIAQALRAANPGAVVEPVLYQVGQSRNGVARRLGTASVRLVLEPGTTVEDALAGVPAGPAQPVPGAPGQYVAEAPDPMTALGALDRLRGRPGVRAASLSAIPTRVAATLERRLAAGGGKAPMPFSQPEEAQRFFAAKRRPVGEPAVPVERYQAALEHMKAMPRHSARGPVPPGAEKIVGTTAASLGSWSELGPGNVGGRTRALLVDPVFPTTMYAGGVAGGVWKSLDGGGSWTATADLIANLAVSSLAMDPGNPSVIYAGTGEGFFNGDAVRGAGIFKTTDGAGTWTQLASTATSSFFFVNKIVVSPLDTQRVYAATRAGVFRSADGGATWSVNLIPGSSVNFGCTDLAIQSGALNRVFAACGTFAQASIFRAADDGLDPFVLAFTDGAAMGRTTLAIAPSSPNIVYALSARNGGAFDQGLHKVFVSIDSGGSWATRLNNTETNALNNLLLTNPLIATLATCFGETNQFFNQGWYDNIIAVDPVDPARVWAGGIDLFRSNDGGANWRLASYWWQPTNVPHYAHADQHAIVFHPGYNGTSNQTMFVGNDGGIFRTTNAATGTTSTDVCANAPGSLAWTDLNNGYAVTQFYHGVPYPTGTTYLGGTQDNGTVRGSDSGFNAWAEVLGGDGGYVAVDPGTPNVLYAENTGLSIQKSIDGGGNFVDAISGINENPNDFLFIAPFIMDPGNAQTLWTGGFVTWRTTNGAGSWSQASSLLCGQGVTVSVSAIAVAPTNRNRVAAGMSDGLGGGCINRTTVGLISTGATQWLVSQPAGTVGAYVSWLAFDPTNENVLYATYSTFGVGHVWRSGDGGATWTNIDGSGATGIPDVPVHSIAVDPHVPSRLYVGTDVGVFASDDGGATWAVENTGFANVITEALAVGAVGSTTHLFGFTHGRGAWRVPTGTAVPALGLSVDVNQAIFTVGQTVTGSVALTNPGLPGAADIYLGLLMPDGRSLVFFTPTGGVAFGTVASFASFRPVAAGVPLAAAFSASEPGFFSYTWTGGEPRGPYMFFIFAVRAGALADGALGASEVLGLATTTFTFP